MCKVLTKIMFLYKYIYIVFKLADSYIAHNDILQNCVVAEFSHVINISIN